MNRTFRRVLPWAGLFLAGSLWAAAPERPRNVQLPPVQALGSPVNVGTRWMFLGDSETDGRAGEATPQVASQVAAFRSLWNANANFTPPEQVHVNGESGRPLAETRAYYQSRTDRGDRAWVHFQESGGQNQPGQQTAAGYADTFEAFVREIHSQSPGAVISVETAYSFEREDESFRNWTHYNTAMRAKFSQLQAEGFPLRLAEADRGILELVKVKGFSQVMMEDGGHFQGLGNFLVALTMFEALGIDVSSLSHAAITDLPVEDRQLCVDIVTGFRNRAHAAWDLSPTDDERVEYTVFRAASPGLFSTPAADLDNGLIQNYSAVIPLLPVSFPTGTHYLRVAARNRGGEYSAYATSFPAGGPETEDPLEVTVGSGQTPAPSLARPRRLRAR